jgi:integrase/recombinase XerC
MLVFDLRTLADPEIKLICRRGDLIVDIENMSSRPANCELAVHRPSVELVEEFRRHQLDCGRKQSTIECYQAVLHSFAEFCPIWPPTEEIVREFLRGYREKGRSEVTIYESHMRLAHWLNWARECGYLVGDPMQSIPNKKPDDPEIEVIPPRQLARVITLLRSIIEKAEPHRPNLPYERAIRDLAIIRLTYATGGRVSEIANLQVRDLNLEDRIAVIQPGKSERRTVYLSRQAVRALVAWLDVRPAIGNYVFTGTKGNGWSPRMGRSGLYQMWIERQHEAEIGPYKFHEIRHSHVTHSMDNGIPLHHISKQAGHASTEITARLYVHSQDAERRRAYEEHNPDDMLGE